MAPTPDCDHRSVTEWHLRELEERLLRRGWDIESLPEPDNVQIAGTWKIARGDRSFVLDFQGFDDLVTFPIEQAFAVRVRDQHVSLYFGKKPTESRPNRSWEQDLAAFVSGLDDL